MTSVGVHRFRIHRSGFKPFQVRQDVAMKVFSHSIYLALHHRILQAGSGPGVQKLQPMETAHIIIKIRHTRHT